MKNSGISLILRTYIFGGKMSCSISWLSSYAYVFSDKMSSPHKLTEFIRLWIALIMNMNVQHARRGYTATNLLPTGPTYRGLCIKQIIRLCENSRTSVNFIAWTNYVLRFAERTFKFKILNQARYEIIIAQLRERGAGRGGLHTCKK